MKQLPAIKFNGGRKVWWAPFLRAIALFAKEHGFHVEEAVKAEAKTLIATRLGNLATSRAADAEFHGEGSGANCC